MQVARATALSEFVECDASFNPDNAKTCAQCRRLEHECIPLDRQIGAEYNAARRAVDEYARQIAVDPESRDPLTTFLLRAKKTALTEWRQKRFKWKLGQGKTSRDGTKSGTATIAMLKETQLLKDA